MSLHGPSPHARGRGCGERSPAGAKGDRWLAGLLAGAVLLYLLGQRLGLGRE